MVITISELRKHSNKYLKLVSKEEIYITKNGKLIAKLTKPDSSKTALLDGLIGLAGSDNIDLESIKSERLQRQ